jgi:hypothetical protein
MRDPCLDHDLAVQNFYELNKMALVLAKTKDDSERKVDGQTLPHGDDPGCHSARRLNLDVLDVLTNWWSHSQVGNTTRIHRQANLDSKFYKGRAEKLEAKN